MSSSKSLKRSFEENQSENTLNFLNTKNLASELNLNVDFKLSKRQKTPEILSPILTSSTIKMHSDNNSVNRNSNTAALSNNNGVAFQLLASGPLFGNIGSNTSSTSSTNGISTTTPSFSSTVSETLGTQNGGHSILGSSQQNPIVAALAAAAAAVSNGNMNNSILPQNQQTEALQAFLNAHAAAGVSPFGVYQSQAMRHSFIGPMNTANIYFDGSGNNPYHPYTIEAGRRKNATREVTQPLKDWLKQHHKNPYPTKAEKTVLAIVTGMTMTQVSTWFANARRRLKKENKMTWSPRNNRNADDEDDDEDMDERNVERPSSSVSVLSDDPKRDALEVLSDNGHSNCKIDTNCLDLCDSKDSKTCDNPRKKIWSIADTISQQQQQLRRKTFLKCLDELKTETNITDFPSSTDSGSSSITQSSKTSIMTAANNGNSDYSVFNSAIAAAANSATNNVDSIAHLNSPTTSSSQPTSSPVFFANGLGRLPNADRPYISSNGIHPSVFPSFPLQFSMHSINQQAAITMLANAAQQQQQIQLQQNQQRLMQRQNPMANHLFALFSQQHQNQQQNQQQLAAAMMAAAFKTSLSGNNNSPTPFLSNLINAKDSTKLKTEQSSSVLSPSQNNLETNGSEGASQQNSRASSSEPLILKHKAENNIVENNIVAPYAKSIFKATGDVSFSDTITTQQQQ